MVSSKGLELLVVSSNLTSSMKTLFKEKSESPHSCQESDTLPGPPEVGTASGGTSTRISGQDLQIPPFQGGKVL